MLLLLALSGCGNDNVADRFFPLAPGQNWQYRIQRTTMDGTTDMRYAVSTVAPPVDNVGVDGVRETIAGQRFSYRITDNGIFRIGDSAHADASPAPQLVLPQTLTSNSTWQAMTRTSVLENTGPPWETLFRIDIPVQLNYAVAALDAEVRTPAGEFHDCLEIIAQGTTNADVGNYIGHTEIKVESREWYAPGIGLVRMERSESTAAEALKSGHMVMELDAWTKR